MGGKPYHSDRIVCRRTGLPVVVLAVPVFGRKQPDRVVGVVAAHYVWAPIQDIIDRVEAPATLHLLNRKGEVIGQGRDASRDVRPLRLPAAEPERIALPGSGGGYAILLRGIHGGDAALVVDVPQRGSAGYRGAGWALLLEMPLEVLFTPIMTLARNTGLLVVGTLLLLAALFAVLGQRFIRPLGDLVQGVREVEQGRFGQKVVVRSRDEFGELAASFNDMAGRLRTTQEELVRREKLALLGQIALGVGDELRTPLGVMSNGVYLLREMIPESERGAREYLDMIECEVDRSERIVAGLMDAVSVLPPRMEMVAVGEVIEQALREVAIPAGVEIRLDIPEWLPQVRVDARQMQKVFRNLISNGVDAMPGGGVLEIRAHEEAAKSLLVSVRDTGVGIAPEQLGRLFQPLFSTKARGIGLGLVVVKNLTEANGGKVGVQSEAGKGTTFSIVLPVASGTGQGELRDHDTVAGPPPISE
jgi:signal transduction histidine kinase